MKAPLIKTLVILGLMAIVVSACSLGPSTVSDEQAKVEQQAATSRGSSASYQSDVNPSSRALGKADSVLPLGTKVIQNASLEIRVGKSSFQDKFQIASVVAVEFGGFVASTSVSDDRGRASSGTLTIRVPADRFDQALVKLKSLGRVTSENRSGQDVTKQFVDLEARLRHAKTQEAFYLRLMEEAKTIADMVSLQQQLSTVQLQIEEIQGQLESLKDQTAYATITSRIFEPGATKSPEPKGLGRAWSEALDGFKTVLGGVVIAAGWMAPFALMGLGGFFAARSFRNRRKPLPVE